MQVKYVFFVLFVLMLLWFALKDSRVDVQYPRAGTSVVVFGDSLAEGYGSTQGNDIASLLEKRLGEPVVNLGISGDTTADGLNRIDKLLAVDPKVVVILLGGNDALRRTTVEETFSNLKSIIQKLHTHGAGVVLVGAPGGLYGSRYNKEYERLAREEGALYVSNILKGLIGKQEYMADSIHPNDAGYRKATDRIEPEVRALLNKAQ